LKVKNFEIEQILSDHPIHKRHAFSFTVEGDEFKGHFHEGEIEWMQPHPKQKLKDENVEAFEAEIHEKIEDHISIS
jgi:hypothetical protein